MASIVCTIGVAAENTQFVMLMGHCKQFEANMRQFSWLSTIWWHRALCPMPIIWDLAIFVSTTTTMTTVMTELITLPVQGNYLYLLICILQVWCSIELHSNLALWPLMWQLWPQSDWLQPQYIWSQQLYSQSRCHPILPRKWVHEFLHVAVSCRPLASSWWEIPLDN